MSSHTTKVCSPRYPTKKSVLDEINRREKKDVPVNAKKLQKGRFQDYSLYKEGVKFFGSWQNAVKESGVDYPELWKRKSLRYPEKKPIIQEIKRRKKNNIPINAKAVQRGEFQDSSLYTQGVKHFGRWLHAVDAAGIDPETAKKKPSVSRYPSQEALLKEIKRRKNESLPLHHSALVYGKAKDSALYHRGVVYFGGWRAALEAAGINPEERRKKRLPSRYPSKEAVLEEIKKRKKENLPLDNTALHTEKTKDPILYRRGQELFGNWRNTLKAAGLEYPRVVKKIRISRYPTKESVIRGIRSRKRKGIPINAKALQTGEFRDCSLKDRATVFFGSWNNALEAAGFDYRKIAKNPPAPYPTKNSVIQGIKRRKKNHLPINAVELEKGASSDSALYRAGNRLFGNWNNTLEAAGFDYRKISLCPPTLYPEKTNVIQEIRRRKDEELALSFTGIKREGRQAFSLYYQGNKLFGSWANAIEAAGLDYRKINRNPKSIYQTKKAVIKEIRRRGKEGLPFNAKALQKGPKTDSGLYNKGCDLFGSWQNAVKKAGLVYPETNRRKSRLYPTEESILMEILRRKRENLPLNSMVRKTDSALLGQGKRQFGSWREALKAAGLDYPEKRTRKSEYYPTKESIIKEIKERKKRGLPLNAKAVEEGAMKDPPLYDQGRKEFGSWRNAIEAAGFDYCDIALMGRYPTKEAVVHAILKRLKKELPLTAGELCQGEYQDQRLYTRGRKEFGQWVYALLIAWTKGTKIHRIAMRSNLEELILREINRRADEGLTLVADELLKSSEEEAALVAASRKIFGNWPNGLRAADVAWDGKGIAKFSHSR